MNRIRTPFKKQNISTRFLISILFDTIANFVSNIYGIVFTSFMLYIGISDTRIAILLSFFGFAQLLQIFSTVIFYHYKHKKRIIYLFRFIRSLLLILTAFIPIVLPNHLYFYALAGLLILRLAMMNLQGGAFAEWNDYYVPESKKGQYYGTRNVLFNLITIILSFLFGILLDYYGGTSIFYLIAFSSSIIFTLISLSLIKDVPFPDKPRAETSSLRKEILVPLTDSSYLKFIGFSILWAFACGIGRPMINVYAIKHLNYTYSIIAIAGSLAAAFKLISGIYFGHMIDKKGGNYVVRLCGIGFGFSTILYAFMLPNNPIIFLLAHVLNGMFMIGFNVSKFRQNMQLSSGLHMTTYLSIHGFFMGLGTFISINISGFIIGLLENRTIKLLTLHINSYQILLVLSGFLNLFAVYYFVRNFSTKEIVHE